MNFKIILTIIKENNSMPKSSMQHWRHLYHKLVDNRTLFTFPCLVLKWFLH